MAQQRCAASVTRDELREIAEKQMAPGAYESVIAQQLLHLLKKLPEPATRSRPIHPADLPDGLALLLEVMDHLEQVTQGAPEPVEARDDERVIPPCHPE